MAQSITFPVHHPLLKTEGDSPEMDEKNSLPRVMMLGSREVVSVVIENSFTIVYSSDVGSGMTRDSFTVVSTMVELVSRTAPIVPNFANVT